MKYKKKTEFLRCRRAQDMLDPRQELLQRFPLEFYRIIYRGF